MSLLTNPCPTGVVIDGKSYQINSDFRVMIQLDEILMDPNSTHEQEAFAQEVLEASNHEVDIDTARVMSKYNDGLSLFYKEIPDDLLVAMDKMIWFFQCGKTEEQKKSEKGKKAEQIYSFTYDADYIYAAFMGQYGIDLNAENLHWWKFYAMFVGLNEDCLMSKIMGYRGADTSGMEATDKKFYEKMKRIYVLPRHVDETKRAMQEEIDDAIRNGRDVAEVVKKWSGESSQEVDS
ncbi:MAG: bacteriophage Gp15 family protein [Lachnospiraceae bacterium]|nr:bacteriophage Gp15 family protein [Lachnospiraceae bacterium]